MAGLIVAAGLVLILLAFYTSWAYRTKRRTGSWGLTQRSRLTCPRCGEQFDHDWVPGAALLALRFGKKRYMACPKCGAWSTFEIRSTIVAPREPG